MSLLLIGLLLVPTVNSIGLGPLNLDITVEKGKETEIVQSIQVSNPEEKEIRVAASVTGAVAQFITLDPKEFTLPAGPGIHSIDPRPSKYVLVTFKIPREITEKQYTGEIIFTQQPIEGGVLGASAQLGVTVKITIGEMANAVFPTYINLLIILSVIVLITSLILYLKR